MNKKIYLIIYILIFCLTGNSLDIDSEKYEILKEKTLKIASENYPEFYKNNKDSEIFGYILNSELIEMGIQSKNKDRSLSIDYDNNLILRTVFYIDDSQDISSELYDEKRISDFNSLKKIREYINKLKPEKLKNENLKLYHLNFRSYSGYKDFCYISASYVYIKSNFYLPLRIRVSIYPTGILHSYRIDNEFCDFKEDNANIKLTRKEAEKIGFKWFSKNKTSYIEEYVVVKDAKKEAFNLISKDKKNYFISDSPIWYYYEGNPVIIKPEQKPDEDYLRRLRREGYLIIEEKGEKFLIDTKGNKYSYDLRPVYPVMIRRKDYENFNHQVNNLYTVYVDAELGIILENTDY